jgi:spore coat protein U-like protein
MRDATVAATPDSSGGSYAIGVTAGGSGDSENRLLAATGGAGGTIPYRIVDSASAGNDLKDIGDNPSSSELLTGSVGAGELSTESFEVLVPGGDLPPPGTYTDTVGLPLYRYVAFLDTYVPVEQPSLDVSVSVPPLVELSLVPVGGSFDPGADSYALDLGFLEEGTRSYLEMLIRANVSYVVTMESANGGNLAHTDPNDSSLVPYRLSVDRTAVDLSAGAQPVARGAGPTETTGTRYEVEVEVLQPGAASSGDYRDMIQVTVTAQ